MTSVKRIQQRIQIVIVASIAAVALALIIGICVGLNVGAKEEFIELECPVGVTGWCEWSQWSSCTHSCGNGEKSRLRSCFNEQGGIERRSNVIQCDGEAVQITPCNAGRVSASELFGHNFHCRSSTGSPGLSGFCKAILAKKFILTW